MNVTLERALGTALVALLWLALAVPVGSAEEWRLVRPSNTGIPGGEVHFAKIDPQGNLWVSARDPFWSEGGIGMYDWHRWTTYSNVDTPLPSEWVSSVAFGADGVIWLGTDGGLVRFDGTDWTIYNSSNTPLPVHQIGSVQLDEAGNVWMVYRQVNLATQGVARFDGTIWTIWPHTQMGFQPSHVLSGLAVMSPTDAWVGTAYAGGMARFNGSSWTRCNQGSGCSDYPGTPVQGDDGNLWALWNGIKLYNGTSWVSKPTPAGNHDFSTLAVKLDGTYWVGTYGGVVAYYNGSNWTPYTYGNHVYSLDFDLYDRLWVGGLAGVWGLNPNGTWTVYNTANTGLGDYWVDGIAFDTAGVAWFATAMAGVSAFDGTVWRGFNPYNFGSEPWPFQTNGADAVVAAPDGKVWILPMGQGVGEWDGSTWVPHLDGWWMDALTVDSEGRAWTGPYQGGLARYNGTSWGFVSTPGYNWLNTLAAGRNGEVYMGSATGLYVYDGATWTVYTEADSGLPDDWVNSIVQDPDGTLWIGTAEGLAHFDGVMWTVYTEANSGVPADVITELAISPEGVLWVGAFDGMTWPYHGGVARFDGTSWTTYTSENSPLPHEQVSAITVAPDGEIWVGTASEAVAVITLDPLPVSNVVYLPLVARLD